ncbi:MAG: hypothetical protein A3E29_01130 [Candidatus Doudnabacteria bacterium RIFCSPHIGHO2_12_FULL_48_16]|uniref:DUF5673 domain-containing protein n=1 Tax=Candidatus Doudnabacteria bacterium RIFCSPHIGHO2_12_FULL_48_16 TaxID=1817838 RepID=A0A1F5PLN1_9BACT|nr:MAG: hypothetical protein A3E29_01130 [Candidatus Doudnabacteria bacterium RIFCSPHIGHO2_12_FULL_48_16]OGE97781.1 MAG: hypothetical protein A2990_03740 [Candidatus Doudnabacteria bacterium RIFCSPLOWO2_01_FULL_49_40]
MPISKTPIKQSPKPRPREISWKTQSSTNPKRSLAWYVIFIILSLAALTFAIFYSESIITVITFSLIILVVLTLSFITRTETTYRLSPLGISAGRMIYPYKTIKKFWINYRPPEVKTLNLETTAYINNIIAIQLGNQDPVAVKQFLAQYLRQDLDHEETAAEILARRLKI